MIVLTVLNAVLKRSWNSTKFATITFSISPIAENTSLNMLPIGSITGAMYFTISEIESMKSLKKLSNPSPKPAKVPVRIDLRSSIALAEFLVASLVADTAPPAFIIASLNASAAIAPDERTLTISAPFFAPNVSDAMLSASVSVVALCMASIVFSSPSCAPTPSSANLLSANLSEFIAVDDSMPFFASDDMSAIESVADIPNCENTACPALSPPVSSPMLAPLICDATVSSSRSGAICSVSIPHFAITSAISLIEFRVSSPVAFENWSKSPVSSTSSSPVAPKRVLRSAIIPATSVTSRPTPDIRVACRVSCILTRSSPTAPVPFAISARASCIACPNFVSAAVAAAIAATTFPSTPKCAANLSISTPKSLKIELPVS